mmetsp:Transcript_7044/g.6296  ORF Transcript_7044/g.6296 Transcript_7044/m.6296 type:complete len:103 (-) Transcript_7044:1930-2238(-)
MDKSTKPNIELFTKEDPQRKIKNYPISRQVLRENIKFANQNHDYIKGTLAIRGKVRRKKMSGGLLACSKRGACSLYVDEQRDEKVITRVGKDMSKMKNLRKF